jgi:hypothetical protein
MSRPSTNNSRPGSTSSRNSLQSTGAQAVPHACGEVCSVMLLAGKLSDSTAKLLEDMAKRSGLALKQINEVSAVVVVVVVAVDCKWLHNI